MASLCRLLKFADSEFAEPGCFLSYIGTARLSLSSCECFRGGVGYVVTRVLCVGLEGFRRGNYVSCRVSCTCAFGRKRGPMSVPVSCVRSMGTRTLTRASCGSR